MKNLHRTATVAALAVGFALPFAAQSLAQETMDVSSTTCADMMAMSQEEQSATMDAMHMASDEMATDDMAKDGMAKDDMAKDDMMSEEAMAMMSACEGNPDMMAMDAMKSSMEK